MKIKENKKKIKEIIKKKIKIKNQRKQLNNFCTTKIKEILKNPEKRKSDDTKIRKTGFKWKLHDTIPLNTE
jgi:hypothetical protein